MNRSGLPYRTAFNEKTGRYYIELGYPVIKDEKMERFEKKYARKLRILSKRYRNRPRLFRKVVLGEKKRNE